MRRTAAVLAGTLAVVTAGCSSTSPGPSSSPASSGEPSIAGIALVRSTVARAASTASDAGAAGAAIDAFGIDLYRKIGADGKNLVFSPSSIAIALGMARAGAKGQTATEMDTVMHGVASDEHAAWLNALDLALASRSGTYKDESGKELPVALRIANATFSQAGMPLEQAYLDALASRYGSGVRLVDYVSKTEETRKAINAWVASQTEQRIKELLVAGVLTPDTRLTLVNAIYLKAPWLAPFPDALTKDGSFTRADRSSVSVSMMTTTASMRYASGGSSTGVAGSWRAVDVPYVGGSLAMTIIEPDDLASFEAGLTPQGWATITGALESKSVALTMPKFSIETKAELADILAALGMPTAFGGGADFSGITKAAALEISNVIHQANIDVDEKGTEAAAATAVVMREMAIPDVVTFSVDRPFIFAVRDVQTGAILFFGRVADPSLKR